MTTQILTCLDPLKQKIAELLLLELTANPQTAGISDDFVNALSAIPLGELHSCASTVASKYLSVEIDFPALEEDFAGERRKKKLLEELIKREASIRFIGFCLGVMPDDIRKVEQRLNLSRNRFAKKIKPDEYDYFRKVYTDALENLRDEAYPQALALIEVAKKTRYPISRIETVVLF